MECNNNRDDVWKRVLEIKKRFHIDRKLLVKHLPRNVLKEEISDLLYDFHVKNINLMNTDDTTSTTATVTLLDPELLDDWNDQRTFLLRGQCISVSPTPTEMVLCVARLPLTYTDQDFRNLVTVYGDIRTYFLMISEKTGLSKGYGFVRYNSKENAVNARNCLNDKMVDTSHIVCDWLPSSHLKLSSLHSKCLYVDQLPKGFKDMTEFRNIFSAVVRPPYCQIALKNGCLQDWGLVEYLSSDDAELAQTTLNGFRYKNHEIRVFYYIPGVRAINLYLQLLNNDKHVQNKSTGLLPEPSGQAVMTSIHNLSKQNPVFAQNLRSIIFNQIQESKMTKESSLAEANVTLNKKSNNNVLYVNPGLISPQNSMPASASLNNAPVILNNFPRQPVISNFNANPLPAASGVSIIPNTHIPPPMLSFTPIMPSAMYSDSTCNGFLFPHTQIASNSAHDFNMPINVRHNVLNIHHQPLSMSTVPNFIPVSTQSATMFPYSHFDPYVIAPPSTMHQQFINSIPVVSSSNPLTAAATWAPVQTIISSPTMPKMMYADNDWSTRVSSSIIMSPPTTPVLQNSGQKRKLLPSPEASPEGDYIGQHSQGIGGHYADSYFKRKRQW